MKHIVWLMVTLALVASAPTAALFAYDDDDNDYYRDRGVNTSSLDDEPIKTFSVPVLFGVILSRVISDFGDPRGNGTREHEGQDFTAPKGTPIISPTEAVVTATGDGESSGKYVYTANPGGESFRYMHLDSIANLKRGQKLQAGDLIGTVGDTGNAPDGVYHLHFEVHDEDRDPTDPLPRLKEDLTLKDKAELLEGILSDYKGDEEEYAQLLVATFPSEFKAMATAGYDLPKEIMAVLEDTGVVADADAAKELGALIGSIPSILTMELASGSQGPTVALLQIYLIYTGEGTAQAALQASGPTGYFGPVTSNAIKEYQTKNKLTTTGVYDSSTRTHMVKAAQK